MNTTKTPAEMTLAEHAEAWWTEQNKQVPDRQTEAWKEMYRQWIEFAFSELNGN
jgi:hypothetical protein